MADFGISIVEMLVETIGSEIIKHVCDTWGYKSQLEELRKTVSTIRMLLLDADNKREELSNVEQEYIRELKDAVYDADDLFDTICTQAELNQLTSLKKVDKFLAKVRSIFHSDNRLVRAHKMSRQVKDIKKRLDDIADNHTKFRLSVDYKPTIRRREETCSYVDAKDIIGRDNDRDTIINMLLDPNDSADFCFLTIVGVGGLGKTALAQLVFNHEKVKKEFTDPFSRLWVCVSDQEGEQFDVKTILCKILESFTNKKLDSSSSLESVQNQFQVRLRGKKYFLVLDDVWNEDREKWLSLEKFLRLGGGGSKILVTSRSEMTATIIGDKHAYKLQGLSEDDSWRLFEMSALHKEHEQEDYHELVKIGKKIVEKCSNVPLAIKVSGSLLYGQDIRKWRSFEESRLAKIGEGDKKIMSILKISYQNLKSSLKSCFSYCAVFPKDFVIEKEMLIGLWMAHGFIVPLDGDQSIEDAAEDHFLVLLRRCFFQDVKRDKYGEVKSVKIHDLMHDVAQEVGKEEICVLTSITNNLGDKIRHVGCVGNRFPINSLCSNKFRSLITVGCNELEDRTINNWMCLRALKLSKSTFGTLPDSIGKLLHLRYLDMSSNKKLKILPNALLELYNLQTLLLYDCRSLRELPKGISKLVKLRHLDINCCYQLSGMPLGMDKLTSLRVLPYFVVGKRKSSEEESDDELKPLKALTEIKGDIHIDIGENYRRVEGINERGGGGYLKSMKHLRKVTLKFDGDRGGCVNPEVVMENLELPSNVKGLFIERYKGTTIQKWGRAEVNWAISLSHLVYISLTDCTNLQEMAMLSKLPHLKSLALKSLQNLEYMENTSNSSSSSSSSDTESATKLATFFPSLENLDFNDLPKLKGWWKGEPSVAGDHSLKRRFRFPRLCHLQILRCPNLTSFPPCPSVRTMKLHETNEKLQIIVKTTGKAGEEDNTAVGAGAGAGAGTSRDDYDNDNANVKLWDLRIDHVSHLKSIATNCLINLEIKMIRGQGRGHGEVENQSEVEFEVAEAFQRCASSLRSLIIEEINNYCMRILCRGGRGLENFTALKSLTLKNVYKHHDHDDDDDSNSMLWKSFPKNLRSLELFSYSFKNLPKGIQYLTSLESFTIENCEKMKELPEWISCLSSLRYLGIARCPALKSLPEGMRNLTSLQRLQIFFCSDLKKRCKEPDGEDRPKIQHIPKIILN